MVQEKQNEQQRVEEYPDGSKYIGEIQNNMRHGRGKFFYTSGGYYEGEWKQGKMWGYAYEGEWQEDRFHGKGIMYNDCPQEIQGNFEYSDFEDLGDFWVKYEGDFKNDAKDGVGKLILSNQEYYEGEFKDDRVHGLGRFVKSNHTEIKGEWIENKLFRTFYQ